MGSTGDFISYRCKMQLEIEAGNLDLHNAILGLRLLGVKGLAFCCGQWTDPP
jgi:hypothetical protein